jgi:hypothetical protein
VPDFTGPNHCLLFHKKPVLLCIVASRSMGELHLAVYAHASKIPADFRSMKLAAGDWSMTCGGSGAESSSTKKFLSWMISHADAAWHLMLLLFFIPLPLCWVCTDYQLLVLCWSSAHALLLVRGAELHSLFFSGI